MSKEITEQGGVYPFPPEEAVENIVLGVMEECSARMHEMFAAGKNEQAEAYRLRLEGAARVAQKLGYLKAADVEVKGEAVSPLALQTGDSGDAAKLNAFHFLRMGGVVKICTGCGSVESLPQIKARHPNAVSCCPERKMVQHRLLTADMLKEVRQSAVKLAAISGRQDEERSDERYQQAAPPA